MKKQDLTDLCDQLILDHELQDLRWFYKEGIISCFEEDKESVNPVDLDSSIIAFNIADKRCKLSEVTSEELKQMFLGTYILPKYFSTIKIKINKRDFSLSDIKEQLEEEIKKLKETK